MMVNNMSDQKEAWRNNFKRMLSSTGMDDDDDTLGVLLRGLESMITKNGEVTMSYDDKDITISSSPAQDEIMFLLFDRRRRR